MNDLSKETLRQEAIRHRDRIHIFNNEDTDVVCELFFDSIKPQKEQIIALYWPRGKEFDPGYILERLLKEGFCCALPVIEKESRILRFVVWKENDPLEAGLFNILQPVLNEKSEWVEPDIVIVPLLAFDRKGYRLGYGGGYYDATLRALRHKKEVVAVGVCYAQQAVIFNLPVEPHDERLDWVITPQQIHRFCD
ncbi:MAG: 5-formyltetrahydrofolate cyclo-ligase [Alphaproteobacteria bacterium CG_4_9_14_3_um_filter_47_13]|nr:MAG: 5-formyltetrahydrofolate cyclo-ligase [Alphaproteobacteria bacterium CG_4_9_14_3_um_filter_47_13]